MSLDRTNEIATRRASEGDWPPGVTERVFRGRSREYDFGKRHVFGDRKSIRFALPLDTRRSCPLTMSQIEVQYDTNSGGHTVVVKDDASSIDCVIVIGSNQIKNVVRTKNASSKGIQRIQPRRQERQATEMPESNEARKHRSLERRDLPTASPPRKIHRPSTRRNQHVMMDDRVTHILPDGFNKSYSGGKLKNTYGIQRQPTPWVGDLSKQGGTTGSKQKRKKFSSSLELVTE